MRIARRFSCLIALVAVVGCGSESQVRKPSAHGELKTGAAALEQLTEQRGRLFDGGAAAFRERLTALRGHPVVVNQWASWCGPCRVEFPIFRRTADRLQGRVAFLGVNSLDNREAALKFLREEPVPFPHYFDEDGVIARAFKGGRALPTTAFYDARGRLAFTHYGQYRNDEDLAEDIRRYARG